MNYEAYRFNCETALKQKGDGEFAKKGNSITKNSIVKSRFECD